MKIIPLLWLVVSITVICLILASCQTSDGFQQDEIDYIVEEL